MLYPTLGDGYRVPTESIIANFNGGGEESQSGAVSPIVVGM